MKVKDFQRLFQVTNIPYLVNDTLLKNYRLYDQVFICRDHTWNSFLPKKVIKRSNKEGAILLSDEHKFREYYVDFGNYLQSSTKIFDQLASQQVFFKEELVRFLDLITKLHFFYIKTEFFYTDQAYKKSIANKTIAEHLDKLIRLKMDGRTHLNRIFFGGESWLNRVLLILSKQFNISVEELWAYAQEELLDLFDGQKVGAGELDRRRDDYVVYTQNSKVVNLFGKEAAEFIRSFLSEKFEAKEISGTVAKGKGMVTGRVALLYYGYQDYDKLHEMIEAMSEGDILVAETTSPEIASACKKAGAIITNQGGLLSHAAIISRELGIPCIVGTGNATEVLKNGDTVEIDLEKGTIVRKNN